MSKANNYKSAIDIFSEEKITCIENMAQDHELKIKTLAWIIHSAHYKYSYLFSWVGCLTIQLPQDIIAMQEIIWLVKPDFSIESGYF